MSVEISVNNPYTMAGVMGFIGIGLFYNGFKALKLKRLIENTPTSKIRSVAMGLVELHGRCQKPVNAYLHTPFSNTPCVHYEFRVEEYRKRKNGHEWVTVDKGKRSTPFYVEDDTGTMIVDPTGAQFDLPSDNRFHSSKNNIPANAEKYLKGFLGFNKRIRITETFIAESDDLYILGTADENVFKHTVEAGKDHTRVMIKKGKNQKTFFIADKSEKEILAGKTWSVPLKIFGGAALTLSGLAVMLIELGILVF